MRMDEPNDNTNNVSHINELFFRQLQQKLSTYFIIRKQAVLLQHIIPEWDLDPKPPNPETVPFPTELSSWMCSAFRSIILHYTSW